MLGDCRIVLLATWVGKRLGHSEGRWCGNCCQPPAAAFLLRSGWPDLDQPYPCGFRPLAALGDIEENAISFIEGREPGWRESRDVDECVLSTTIPSDEAKALVDIEPLHRSGFLDRCVGRWPARCLRSDARSAWRSWSSRSGIDAQHLGDVWPFVSGTNPDFQAIPRLHGVDAPLSENCLMEKSVAGTIG